MALVTYRRDQLLSNVLGSIASENGFINIKDAPMLGSIIRAVESALSAGYRELYDIAKNVDIGRASGQYLDRWGNLLGEPRTTVGYASDLSLTNTSIFIRPEVTASQLTIEGTGITIPSGTLISSEDGTYSVTTVGDALMLPNRSEVFVKVIATSTYIDTIPAGVLNTVSLSLADIPNVIGGASRTYRLIARNRLPITGGRGIANDELYRYILKESAQSLWLFNEARIRKLLDILQVRQIIIDEYRGGVVVYIETTDPSVAEGVAHIAEAHLASEKPVGYALTVSPVILRHLRLTVGATFDNSDPGQLASLRQQFAQAIAAHVNNYYAGESVDILSCVAAAADQLGTVTAYSVRTATVDHRALLGMTVSQRTNQKLYLDPTLVVFE